MNSESTQRLASTSNNVLDQINAMLTDVPCGVRIVDAVRELKRKADAYDRMNTATQFAEPLKVEVSSTTSDFIQVVCIPKDCKVTLLVQGDCVPPEI